jgi:tRNA dimethylallyltransferase
MEKSKPRAVILTGPTGSGKTSLAIQAALALGGEIINADSLAFYRGLDIGTAKPTKADRSLVPHHLLDILSPEEDFDAKAYLALARPLAENLAKSLKVPLIVGGTGLYLQSLIGGLFAGPGRQEHIRAELKALAAQGVSLYDLLVQEDPLAAEKINPRDHVRLERALEVKIISGRSITEFQADHGYRDRIFETLVLIIDRPTEDLDIDLKKRTGRMFEEGLIEETKSLLSLGYSPQLKPLQAIGYREAQECLAGRLTLAQAKEKVYLRTRRLAKRQRTWFRGRVPEGLWVKPEADLIIRLMRDFWGRI